MFCVFLQTIPPDEYQTIDINHNDMTFTFSKDLSLKNSEFILDLIQKQPERQIIINFDFEYDEFQLISDLFNYKRIFITKYNIDFLEFAANYLKIPILIKKTTKFRNHYQDFMNNQILQDISKLQKHIFSICDSNNANSDSDDDYSDESTGSEDFQDDKNPNSNNQINLIKTDDVEVYQEKSKESEQKAEDNSKANENQVSKEKIQYNIEYSSTVAHIIYSACLSNPFLIRKCLTIVEKDQILLEKFQKIIQNDKLNRHFCNLLKKLLTQKYFPKNSPSKIGLDTDLKRYLHPISLFYTRLFDNEEKMSIFIETMKNDDVDLLQQLFISHIEETNDMRIFKLIFNLSAILSAVKCFKYLLLNGTPLFQRFTFDDELVRSSIIGGNMEIFRLSLEKYSGSATDFIKDSILFHRTKIMKWLIQNDIQFLSIYNSSCSIVLYGPKFIRQKWYICKKCHPAVSTGVCKFCAKHCHKNEEGEENHDLQYKYISDGCYCDDNCPLSKNIEIIGNKKFVEIDDLILLSFYCLNIKALKILVNEGAYILRCRDRPTKESYTLGDEKLNEIICKMRGYKPKGIDEVENPKNIYWYKSKSEINMLEYDMEYDSYDENLNESDVDPDSYEEEEEEKNHD